MALLCPRTDLVGTQQIELQRQTSSYRFSAVTLNTRLSASDQNVACLNPTSQLIVCHFHIELCGMHSRNWPLRFLRRKRPQCLAARQLACTVSNWRHVQLSLFVHTVGKHYTNHNHLHSAAKATRSTSPKRVTSICS